MTDAALILRVVSSFAVVALVLYGFAVVSRQWLGSRPGARPRLVSVIETTPLAPNASLYVVKVGERYHVLGHAAGGLSLLTEIDAPIVERCATERKFSVPLRVRPRARSTDARTPAGEPAAGSE